MTSHLAGVQSLLTLQSRRSVLSELEGEFTSLYTGPGTDFQDLREYVRGDDVKHVDWKASARTGGMLVRRFAAVRKHTVLLVVSTGRSMAARHTVERTKIEVALDVAGLVGWLATRQSDLVGVVHGDQAGQSTQPPSAGGSRLDRALEATHRATRLEGPASDTAAVLGHLVRSRRQRAIVLLVCDDQVVTPELGARLRRAAVQHDLLAVTIGDLDPAAVPASAPTAYDVDSGRRLPRWVREDAVLAREVVQAREREQRLLHADLVRRGVVHEHLHPGASPLSVVRNLLVRHRHAPRRT